MGRKSRQKAKRNQKQKQAEGVVGPATAPGLDRVLIACALVGLAFSAMLYADYAQPGSGLCSVIGGGCDAVRSSAYSSVAGVSVPTLGIAFFLALMVVTITPALRAAVAPLAIAGALAGITFIGLQGLVIGAWCPFCLVVDFAAIGAGIAAFMGHGTTTAPLTFGRAASTGALAILALAMVNLGGGAAPAEVDTPGARTEVLPGVIAELQKEAPVTVVEFIDFQCPACTYQHRIFQQILERVDYDVNFVYLHAPLPQHEYAVDAARAYLCAEEQGEGESMADGLYMSPAPTPDQIQRFVDGLQLDADAFNRCLMSQRVEERLQLDQERAREAGLRSLPTFWIGPQKFVGAGEPAQIIEALDRLAGRGEPTS